MESSNIILNGKAVKDSEQVLTEKKVTRAGVAFKTLMGIIIMIGVYLTMFLYPPLYEIVLVLYLPLSIIFIISFIVLVIAASRNVKLAKIAFFGYALVEGALLGVVSIAMNQAFPGIVGSAALLTLGISLSSLTIYMINPKIVNQKFIGVVMAAMMGIGFIYMISFFTRIFGGQLVEYNSNASILFTVVVLIFASLLLMVDFKRVDMLIQKEVSKEYEWLLALGILTTIVWIYIEALKLFSKLRSRR